VGTIFQSAASLSFLYPRTAKIFCQNQRGKKKKHHFYFTFHPPNKQKKQKVEIKQNSSVAQEGENVLSVRTDE
jgi:hypothetical protein